MRHDYAIPTDRFLKFFYIFLPAIKVLLLFSCKKGSMNQEFEGVSV